MNKIIFLILFIINASLSTWADEVKPLDGEVTKIEAEDFTKKKQSLKDQEIKAVYINLFKNNSITKED